MNSHQLINQDSGGVEMYTPSEIIEAARRTMGTIDLDPASCKVANITVKASGFFGKYDDGLTRNWNGNIWMNHPFGKGEKTCKRKCVKKICKDRGSHIDEDIPGNNEWIDYLINQYETGNIIQSCNITFGSTSEKWFQKLAVYPQCIIAGRTNYIKPDGSVLKGNTKGSVVTYLGENIESFAHEFSKFGRIKIDWDMVGKLIKKP